MELKQKFKFKTLLFMLSSVFKAAPVLFPLFIVIKIFETLLGVVALYVLKDATNMVAAVITNEAVLDKTILITFGYLLLMLVVESLLYLVYDIIENYYYKNADRYFRIILMYKLGNLSQEELYDKVTYDKYNYAYKHLYVFQQLPYHVLNFVIEFSFQKMVYLGVIFSFNIWAGLISVALFIINLVYTIFYTKRRVDMNKKFNNEERQKNNLISLISQKNTIKETKVNCLEEYFFDKQDEIHRKIEKEKYKIDRKETTFSRIMNTFIFIMKLGFDIFLLYLIFDKQIDIGTMVLIRTALASATQIGRNFVRPLARLVEFVGIAPVICEMIFPLTKEEKRQIKKLEEPKFELKYGDFESVKLENISYKYPSCDEYAIKNINLEIKRGDIVSILGYNGSGKTTTSKIMLGLFKPTEGNVYLNGVNINEISRNDLSMYYGVGFQEFARYELTMKENIGFGKIEEMDNEELINDAIKKTNLQNIIDDLPNGTDTYLGKKYDKKGQDLSGGQWQRVILARAYMGGPEVLVLDEPTAAIDPIEEERMLNEFKNNLVGKTAILISHRIAFARLASKIIIMKDGSIIESGTHEELLEKHGYYHELFTSQHNLYNGDENEEV